MLLFDIIIADIDGRGKSNNIFLKIILVRFLSVNYVAMW